MSAEEPLSSSSSLTIKKTDIPIKTLIITLVMPEYEDFISFSAILKVEKIELKTKVWITVDILANCLIVMASDHKNKHWGNTVWWHKWIEKAKLHP